MKLFATYLLFLIPCFSMAQLFPKMPDLNGSIEKVIEKRYGKEITTSKKDSGIFKPKAFSGWKYIQEFDEQNNLIKRTNIYRRQVVAAYTYQRRKADNRLIVRETTGINSNGEKGDYLEYEIFEDSVGRPVKVNFWAFNRASNRWEIFQVEQNAIYDNDKLISFTRFLTSENGDFPNGETITIDYTTSGQISHIRRDDQASGFRSIITYEYNNRGLIEQSTMDFLTEIQEYKRTQIQKINFRYDKKGNWTRKYIKSGDKKILEAKRKIKYR